MAKKVENQDPKLEINIVREQPKPEVTETKLSEPALEMEVWRMYSPMLFKVQPEIFDGAFHGKSGQFTKTECLDIIKEFLNKPILN